MHFDFAPNIMKKKQVLAVPTELLFNVFEFLTCSDIVHIMALASKEWREIAYSNRIWKFLCKVNFSSNTTNSDIHERQEEREPGFWLNFYIQKCHYICKDQKFRGVQPLLLQCYNIKSHKDNRGKVNGKKVVGVTPEYLSTKDLLRIYEPIRSEIMEEMGWYGYTEYDNPKFLLYEFDMTRLVILVMEQYKTICAQRYVVQRKDNIEVALGFDKVIDEFYQSKFKGRCVKLADRKKAKKEKHRKK